MKFGSSDVDTFKLGSSNVDKLMMGSELAWEAYSGPASPVIITSDTTLTAGTDFPANTELTICMVGGGGAGGSTWDCFGNSGGGYAGQIVNQTVSVSAGESVSVIIGSGGVGRVSGTGGLVGSSSSFGAIVASGGGGGGLHNPNYAGTGGSTTNCQGTFTDGNRYSPGGCEYANGGQAGFGNGGVGGHTISGYPSWKWRSWFRWWWYSWFSIRTEGGLWWAWRNRNIVVINKKDKR